MLGRKLHIAQWVGVVTIVAGLTISSVGAASEGKDIVIGVCLILTGSMLHSLTYIIAEKILLHVTFPMPPEILASVMGLAGVIVYGIWQCVYTIPNFDLLIIDKIHEKQGSVTAILLSFLGLVVVNLAHALCFFRLIGALGATTTGVTKGAQTVLVFLVSHFAFCSTQSSQCFTLSKGISLGVVVIGESLMMYFAYKSALSSSSCTLITQLWSDSYLQIFQLKHSLFYKQRGNFVLQLQIYGSLKGYSGVRKQECILAWST
jgi:drug/metabolite transporter (DMT)-like permease